MSSSGKKHDVFISFRGQHTSASFTSHLYGALTREKIKTYIDYARKIDFGLNLSKQFKTQLYLSLYSQKTTLHQSGVWMKSLKYLSVEKIKVKSLYLSSIE
ncbi:unnamed protein product [Lathyrus sativus]|nr:unnamed protein product [Lathyrus sativus]